MNGRSKAAIKTQVRKLGLKTSKTWTKEEIKVLKEYYPQYGSKLDMLLPNKSVIAIRNKASKLGLYKERSNKYKYVIKDRGKFVVRFTINGKMTQFGTYDTEEEAAKVAMEKAKEYGKAI